MFYKKEVLKSCLFKLLFICLSASITFAYSGGSGTVGSPYQIASKDDLLALAATPTDYGKCFILTADINMAGQTFTTAIIAPDTSSSTDFQGTAFTGTFDGSGHKIINFTINGDSNGYIGLFGYINGGSVKNLGIENFSVNGASFIGGLVGWKSGSSSITNCYSTGEVSGDSYVGGLVGYDISGNISSCYSACSVYGNNQYVGGLVGCNGLVGGGGPGIFYGGNITNCYSTGAVCGYYYIGGLVGYNYNIITNCYSTSAVLGSGYLGGLAGYNKDTISRSYSTGTVIGYDQYLGGLVGYNYGDISNCYSTGEVDGSWTSYVGGLVGYNYTSTSYPNPPRAQIYCCYSTGAVSGIGSSYVGGLVGYDNDYCVSASYWDINTSGRTTSYGGTGKTTAQMKILSTFTKWDFITVWDIDDGQTYPYLFKKTNYSGGNGTPAAPYQIANVEDLLTMANTVADYNKCFIQTADINMAGRTSSIALIAPDTDSSIPSFQGTAFTGTFDGNDHKISHFRINGNSSNRYVGLFGYINGGSVKNLGIENFSVSGYYYVGGMVGYNDHSSITNCYSMGDVNSAVNSRYIGGLVGRNYYSSIADCYSTGTVSIASNSQFAGGLVGYSYSGCISNCYSTSAVTGASGSASIGDLVGINYIGSIITNCYSTGAICVASGSYDIGGLVGYNGYNISNSYSIGTVSGASGSFDIGGLVGHNGYNISNCYSAGAVSGSSNSKYLGGFTGDNDSNIINCYSTGAVSGDSGSLDVGGLAGRNNHGLISNCYSTGLVSGSSNVGGLVGDINSGIISASFWDVNSSGQLASAGGEGKTTTEMKTESTFTSAGWDFSYADGNDAIWYMAVDGYPILTWQISPADIYTDGKNNFLDFAVLARYWMRDDCRRYNNYCDWADLNFDGAVDIDDLVEFMTYWLEQGIYE